MDGVELQVLWSNLIGIVSEQACALKRIAFSPIVREAGDRPMLCSMSRRAWWHRR
jgi:N-methylhydantoinase B